MEDAGLSNQSACKFRLGYFLSKGRGIFWMVQDRSCAAAIVSGRTASCPMTVSVWVGGRSLWLSGLSVVWARTVAFAEWSEVERLALMLAILSVIISIRLEIVHLSSADLRRRPLTTYVWKASTVPPTSFNLRTDPKCRLYSAADVTKEAMQ